MIDKTWVAMSDLEDSFNQITTFGFLIEQLKSAVDSNNTQKIIDCTAALDSFYKPYCSNWDDKFAKVWELVVKK